MSRASSDFRVTTSLTWAISYSTSSSTTWKRVTGPRRYQAYTQLARDVDLHNSTEELTFRKTARRSSW